MPKARASLAGVITFGMNVQYECDKGHTLTGTKLGDHHFHRACLKDGKFEESNAECKPISAGPVPKIENAKIISYAGREVEDGEELNAYYPMGLEYKCTPGYSLTGGPEGQTKFVTQVNSIGDYVPALPGKCKLIVFTVKGEIKDSRTGASLVGARVEIEGRIGSVLSDQGFFTLTDIAPGRLKLKFTKDGFIPTEKELDIIGDVHSGGIADLNMSPKMASNQWRAAIKWGDYPEDLDSYLEWGQNMVCWYERYLNTAGEGGAGVRTRLEVDDTDGIGPETVYMSGVGMCDGDSYKCDLKYMINDYGETSEMFEQSDAQVTLYNGERVAGSWRIRDCPDAISEDRNWWHVFTIDAKTNKLKWHCGQGAMLLDMDANTTLNFNLIHNDFNNYVGPFPGRYLGKHQHHAHAGAAHKAKRNLLKKLPM